MITSTEPQVAATDRYSIFETCHILGIHRNSLARYTEQGRIKCGFRRHTARKFYTGTEIIKFWKAQL